MWTTEDTKATAALLVGLGVLLMLLAIAAGAEPRAEPQRPIPPPVGFPAAPTNTALGEEAMRTGVLEVSMIAFRRISDPPSCRDILGLDGWAYLDHEHNALCICRHPYGWETADGALCAP